MDVIQIDKTEVIDIEDVSMEFLRKWGIDANTEDFNEKLESFLRQTNGNKKLKNILLKLIMEYEYYSKSTINKILEEINEKVDTELNLNSDETIYSRIEDDSKIDSSNTLLEEYKIINEISNNYSHDLAELDHEDMKSISNVVFIDDIIGTGKTVKSFFDKHYDKLTKVHVYIFCIIIMSEAKQFLQQYFREKGINCSIVCEKEQKKAFERDVVFGLECEEAENELRKHEENLWRHRGRMILGYNNSQALVSFYRNTPNNTISSFWFNRKQWTGLFPRNSEVPKFIRKRKERKNSAYHISSLRNNNGD